MLATPGVKSHVAPGIRLEPSSSSAQKATGRRCPSRRLIMFILSLSLIYFPYRTVIYARVDSYYSTVIYSYRDAL